MPLPKYLQRDFAGFLAAAYPSRWWPDFRSLAYVLVYIVHLLMSRLQETDIIPFHSPHPGLRVSDLTTNGGPVDRPV